MTLAEFLLARIAEDERYAHHARGLLGIENEWWSWEALKDRFPDLSRADAQHIARHSPDRILADCEAKRRIVALVEHPSAQYPDYDGGYESAWEEALRLLALPYANHPDYRDEWKPQ